MSKELVTVGGRSPKPSKDLFIENSVSGRQKKSVTSGAKMWKSGSPERGGFFHH